MARVRDIPALDDEPESPEWGQDAAVVPGLSARRSLERLLERRALRRQLEDIFGEDNAGLGDFDW